MKNENIIEKNRYNYIDLLKVIAIFLVVFYHSISYQYNFLINELEGIYFTYFINTFLAPCIPIFFLVNGYLLFSKKLDLKKHILRMIQLIVLAFIWGIISLLIIQVCRNEYFTVKEFFYALFNWKQGWINHLWFIGCLIGLHIFFPILKIVYDNNKKVFNYFVIITFILTIGNTLINEVSTILNFIIFNNKNVFDRYNFFTMFNVFRGITASYSFVYFCLGGILYDLKEKIIKIKTINKNIVLFICILISNLGLWFTGIVYSKATLNLWDVVWEGYGTIFVLVSTLSIFVLCLNYKKENKIIEIISKNTLGIYFIHMIIIEILKLYVNELNFTANILFTFVFANVVMYLSLIVSCILGRIPFISKLVK